MKLFVDDERPIPTGWDGALDPETAIRRIATMEYEEISLDHDAGEGITFQPVAYLIAEKYKESDGLTPKISVHTANPVGRKALFGILNRYRLLAEET